MGDATERVRTERAGDAEPGATAEATRLGVEVLPVLGRHAGLEPGGRFAGHRIEAVIGRGGMGIVYRAVHLHLERTVALKVLAPELAHDAGFRERFIREARIVASLRHPHIVPTFDAGETGGLLYMSMAYVEGGDLAELMARGPLDRAATVSVLGQVAAALDAAHSAGLVHRDVKPGNILLEGEHAYLTDFGLAKAADVGGGPTRAGQVVGTLNYLAPEQIEGGTVDGRTDVYALGCLLFHCLGGAPPYARDSDVQVMFAHVQQPVPSLLSHRPDLPAEIDAVLAQAMAKRPEERHASCGALMDATQTALGMRGAMRAAASADPDAGTILLAIGDPRVKLLARGALAPGGFDLVEETDPGRVRERAREARPDVVIVAWEELGADAAETCRLLRADSAGAPRILAIGPRSPRAEVRAELTACADDHVVRPFSALHLLLKARALGPVGADGA